MLFLKKVILLIHHFQLWNAVLACANNKRFPCHTWNKTFQYSFHDFYNIMVQPEKLSFFQTWLQSFVAIDNRWSVKCYLIGVMKSLTGQHAEGFTLVAFSISHEKFFFQRFIHSTGKPLKCIWEQCLTICNSIKEAEKLLLNFAEVCIFQTKWVCIPYFLI